MSNLFEEQETMEATDLKKKKFYKGPRGQFTSCQQAEIYKAKENASKYQRIAKFWENKCHRLEMRLRDVERRLS